MSERSQAARAELLRLIKRYIPTQTLGEQAVERLHAAVEEIEHAAVEAHRLLTQSNPAELLAGGPQHVDTPSPGMIVQDGNPVIVGSFEAAPLPTLTIDATTGAAVEGGGISVHTDGVERLRVPDGQDAIVDPPTQTEATPATGADDLTPPDLTPDSNTKVQADKPAKKNK